MRVSQQWYQGTPTRSTRTSTPSAASGSKFVFILSGDHIYKMNYSRMLQQHCDSGADVTVAPFEIPAPQAAKQFGVIETDKEWRIIGFRGEARRPQGVAASRWPLQCFHGNLHFQHATAHSYPSCDSEDPKSSHDFGKDILPRIISKHRVFAYNFVDEKRQGRALLARRRNPRCLLRGEYGSRQRVAGLQSLRQQLASSHLAAPVSPAKFVFADPERMGVALDSIVAGGSVISGGRVQKSVIGNNVRVNSYSEVSDSIIYNHVTVGPPFAHPPRHHRPSRQSSERTEIGYDLEADKRRFHVTDSGIVIVVRQESLIEEPESA